MKYVKRSISANLRGGRQSRATHFLFWVLGALLWCASGSGLALAGDAAAKVAAGPMLGHVDIVEATIWLQTRVPARVSIRYRAEGGQSLTSASVETERETYHTAHIRLPNLKENTEYSYQVLVDGEEISQSHRFKTQANWKWRRHPPDFRFALGSCYFNNEKEFDRDGKPYGDKFHIFDNIAAQKPDFMIWMGDNTYFRESDFFSVTRLNRRMARDRGMPFLQKLLASTAHYATWDDHDFGPDDGDRSYQLKDETLRMFKLYWANPAYGLPEAKGVFGKFEWADCEFFLLDDRYHRAPHRDPDPDKPYLGPVQLQWLKDQLITSRATFKFIVNGNQVVNTYSRHESYHLYRTEHQNLMNWLNDHAVEGVVFLSGDRHYSELLKMERPGSYPLYEFTSSPLTSGTIYGMGDEADNHMRVPGALLTDDRNFGIVEITGEGQKNRVLTFKSYDSEGKLRFEHQVKRSDLEIKKRKRMPPKFPSIPKKKKK